MCDGHDGPQHCEREGGRGGRPPVFFSMTVGNTRGRPQGHTDTTHPLPVTLIMEIFALSRFHITEPLSK